MPSLIRGRCDDVIEACEAALQSPLITDDKPEDDPAARRHLERAVAAARALRDHLDSAYEFRNGCAELREADNAAN